MTTSRYTKITRPFLVQLELGTNDPESTVRTPGTYSQQVPRTLEHLENMEPQEDN